MCSICKAQRHYNMLVLTGLLLALVVVIDDAVVDVSHIAQQRATTQQPQINHVNRHRQCA